MRDLLSESFPDILPLLNTDLPDRAALPLLLARLHHVPLAAVLPEAEEALHQVHRPLRFLHLFPR